MGPTPSTGLPSRLLPVYHADSRNDPSDNNRGDAIEKSPYQSVGSSKTDVSHPNATGADEYRKLVPGPRQTAEMPSQKLPWWTRYRGYQPFGRQVGNRKRRTILVALVIGSITTLVVILALWKSGKFAKHQSALTTHVPGQGTYIGQITPQSNNYPQAIEAYRGIPYAQTTAGKNRFRPPQPLNQTGVYKAIEFGPTCPQGGKGYGQSEDCLNLNIYRPHLGPDGNAPKKMPVVIYVHGGGFNTGAGKERNMASFVSWADMPIIGMSFNYRLGALGFPLGPVALKEGAVNLGLKDQQMLFQWVQDNIEIFGGDPDNVTIMGLSAGAHSVGHQLISYSPANKLTSDPAPFHRAIIESGGSLARATFYPTHSLHMLQWEKFLARLGLNETADEDLFDKLRELPLRKVASASNFVWRKWYSSLKWAFQPVIDGVGGIIPDPPIESWVKGNVMRIPMIAGFDTNEGTIFVPDYWSDPASLRNLISPMIPALNQSDISHLEDTMYPDVNTPEGQKLYDLPLPSGFGTEFWRLSDAYSHYAYICPTLQSVHLASLADTQTPVYAYHFAARSRSFGGTNHGDEAIVVSHEMSRIGKHPGLIETAKAMNGFWTRFAAYGDPEPRGNTIDDDTKNTTWTRYVSPFANETIRTASGGVQLGMINVFGQGNDERMGLHGSSTFGVPTQMNSSSEKLKTDCEWWWDRVGLSEGWGNRSTPTTRSSLLSR